MAKEWKHIDLSTATIFDLTDDDALIRQAEDCLQDEETPQAETYGAEHSRDYIVTSMLSYAEITGDEPLYRAILKANPDYEETPVCIPGAKIFG